MRSYHASLFAIIASMSLAAAAIGASPEGRKPIVFIVEAAKHNQLLPEWDLHLGRPDDIVSSAPLKDNRMEVSKVKVGQHAWMSPSAATLREEANQAGPDIRWVFYDLEHWGDTPDEERKDPITAVRNLHDVCQQRGWKLGLVPDNKFGTDIELAKTLAPYLDAYVVQCQKFQNKAQVEKIRSLAKAIRRANPNCQVGAQLGVGVPEKYGPDSQAVWFYRETSSFLDLYSVWWGKQESMIALMKELNADR
jgi:hypothetical protein